MEWYFIVLIVISAITLQIIIGVIFFFYCLFFKKSPWNTENKVFKPCYPNKEDYEALKVTQGWLNDNKNKVHIISKDGLNLYGCYIKHENAKSNIICFHGYRGKPDADLGSIAPFLYNNEANILLVYMRCTNPSEGKFFSFGVKEKDDVISWIDFVKNENDLPIFLFGRSMGCSSILFSLTKPLDNRVKGILADCGYYSAYEEYVDFLKPYIGPLGRFCVFLINTLSGTFLSLNIKTLNFLKQNTCNRLPIFFSVGDKDNIIPYNHTIKMYESYKGKKILYVVKGAKHLQTYDYGGDEFKKALTSFLNSCL